MEKPRNFVLGKRRGYSEIGTVLELFQVCKNWAIWPAHTENGATHLGFPSECANGPSNLGPRILKVGAIHRALSGEWTRGAQ